MSVQTTRGLVSLAQNSQYVRADWFLQFKNWNGVRFIARSLDALTPGEWVHSTTGGGKCSEAVNNTTLRDGSRQWNTNQWQYRQVLITSGVAAGEIRTIASNNGTDLVLSQALPGVPDANTYFVILGAGTATGGAPTTLVDTTKNWPANIWQSHYAHIISGTGAGQIRQITSNTGSQLNMTGIWTTTPDATSVYRIGRAVNQASVVEEPVGNLYASQYVGTPLDSSFLYGISSRASAEGIDAAYSVDFVEEEVAAGHIFAMTEDNEEQFVEYVVGGQILPGYFMLSAVYAGETRYGVTYVVQKEFDAYLTNLPLPGPRTLFMELVVRAGFLALSQAIQSVSPLTLPGNARKSQRVNATETGIEAVRLLPADGSEDLLGLLKGPAGVDPSHADHLTRKAYVDALVATLLDLAGTRAMTGPFSLDYKAVHSDTVYEVSATSLKVSPAVWTADEFNTLPSGYSHYAVRIVSGAQASRTTLYNISNTTEDTLTLVSPGFGSNLPAFGDAFEIVSVTEDRVAASRGYASELFDSMALNPLKPYRAEAVMTSSQSQTEGWLGFLTEISALTIPGADGVRKYKARIRLALKGSVNSALYAPYVGVTVVANATGLGLTDIVFSRFVAVPMVYLSSSGFDWGAVELETGLFIPTDVKNKLGVFIQLEGYDTTFNGAATEAHRCSVVVEEVIEREA